MSCFDDSTKNFENNILKTTFRCRNCNYCYSRCPLYRSMEGFMINGPAGIIQAIYYFINWNLNDKNSKDELLNILYSCTTCRSCEITCEEMSAGIPLLEIIEEGRKYLIDNNVGPLPEHRDALKAIYKKGNPYNINQEERFNWIDNSNIKIMPNQYAKTLLYIGCSTSFDPDLQNVGKCLIDLLNNSGVDYGILEDEKCCSCLANRLGDEFLFEEMMKQNVRDLNISNIENMIVVSPHCYNSFMNEYKGLNNINIYHYTQYLYKIIKENKMNFSKELNYTITYHDPCYLGKHNGIYEIPREIINSIPGLQFVEMDENRKFGLCCGGGGGRMWSEIKEEKKLSHIRIEQVLSKGADVVVTACPWCHTMLKDAVKDFEQENNIKVMDMAEILVECL